MMTKNNIKQTLKDRLKDCDKDTLIDIIADVCSMYIGAKLFTDMSNVNCTQQCVNNVQTNFQEIDSFLTQRINTNLKKL